MQRSGWTLFVVLLAVGGMVFGLAPSVSALTEGQTCRSALGREGRKFLSKKATQLQRCNDKIVKGKFLPGACPDQKATEKINNAIANLGTKVGKFCGGADGALGGGDDQNPADLGFPSTCPTGATPINTMEDLVSCIEARVEADVDNLIAFLFPMPFVVETFASDLEIPVTMAFAPDGRLFFNELRTGNVRIIQNGTLLDQPFATVPVDTNGERGLLGLSVDPDCTSNHFVYIFHTHPSPLRHRVVRFTDVDNVGMDETVIVDNLPVGVVHNGGNIGFGTDGKLYVTIGENGNPANAQDTSPTNRAGKILRYNANGTIPANNPLGDSNPIFAYGLRNSFDFTFHPTTGVIYATENGPNCDDEVNRIIAGGNYGWRPSYPCGDTDPSFVAPLVRFTPTIAPTGATFYTGNTFPALANDLLFVDFNQGKIRRLRLTGPDLDQIEFLDTILSGGFGALLDIVTGPDGFIYFSSFSSIFRLVPP